MGLGFALLVVAIYWDDLGCLGNWRYGEMCVSACVHHIHDVNLHMFIHGSTMNSQTLALAHEYSNIIRK